VASQSRIVLAYSRTIQRCTLSLGYDEGMWKRITKQAIPEFALLGVTVYAMLWRGGKSLAAVWTVIFLSCALVFLGMFFFRKEGRSRVPSLLWWSGILYLFLSILSFGTSLSRNYGLDELFQTASLLLVFFWMVRWSAAHPTFQSRFFRVVSATLLLACAIGVVVYVFQPVSRFVGTFFNAKFHTDYWPNAWAEEILLLWPMLLWVLWGRKSKRAGRGRRPDWLKAAVLGLVIGSLLLSYSRGGALVFLGQLLLLALLMFLSRGSKFPWRRAVVIGLMTLAAALTLFAGLNHVRSRFHPIESVARKVTFSSNEGASSISERVQFWKQAVFLAGEKPFLGWGPYSFRFVQPRLQHSVLATSDHPHNVFLKIAMERGIPAAFFFLLFIVAVLMMGVRKFLSDGGLKNAVLLVGVAGVLAHNMIDYNLQFVGISLPLWVSFGLLAGGKQTRDGGLLSKGVEVTVAVLLLVLALTEGTFLYFSSIARRAEAAGDSLSALEWYNRTNRALFSRDQWLSRGVISLSLGRLSDARLGAERYLQMNEQDARGWRLLGDIGLRAGNYREAFNAYTRAYAFGRYNDIGITRGFVYVSAHSKLLGARRKDVDELMNEFGLAIEQNTHFIALSKNVEELVSLSDLMAQLFPADHQAYRALAREATLSAREVRARFTARSRGLLW